jgi:hypothetical protein
MNTIRSHFAFKALTAVMGCVTLYALASPAWGQQRQQTIKNWPIPKTTLSTGARNSIQSVTTGSTASTTGTDGLAFIAITPCRLVDTRTGEGTTGAFGPPALAGSVARTIPVPQSSCGVPAAAAYSLNFAVIVPNGGSLGYLSAWPDDENWPGTVVLNALQGGIVDNSAIVPAGADGGIQVMATHATDLVIDINGYFIARSLVKYRGEWNSATPYAVGDLVTFKPSNEWTGTATSTYISIAANTNIDPYADTLGSNGTAWAIFAAGGRNGAPGSIGPAGATGATGPAGAPGIPGPTGATGPVGPAGATGPQGLTGPAGAPGPIGPIGMPGVAGPAGATGPAGPPVTFQGTWSGSTPYAQGDAVSYNGSSYISLVSGNLNQLPAETPAVWGLLASKGDTGPTGLTGAEGPQGIPGITGAQGPQGVAGPAGAQGPVGPAGPTGATGPQGPSGALILLDKNGLSLGRLISYDTYFYYTVLSPIGNLAYSVGIDGAFPGEQIYWTGPTCTGVPYLNDGSGGGQKRNGKAAFYSKASNTLYQIDPSTVDSSFGAATSVAIASQSIENPGCQSSVGNVAGWRLTPVDPADIGINASGTPLVVAAPLQLQ